MAKKRAKRKTAKTSAPAPKQNNKSVLTIASAAIDAPQSALLAKINGRQADDLVARVHPGEAHLKLDLLESARSYDDTPAGSFTKLDAIRLRWVREDFFEFIPKASGAFSFQRSNGQRIEPRRMFTDGGSIPKLIWGVQGFSPWGSGPAFLIHDWSFDAHHCGGEQKTFEQVRDTMMEAVKTLMEIGLVKKDKSAFGWIQIGISSSIARTAWDRPYPVCPLPPDVAE